MRRRRLPVAARVAIAFATAAVFAPATDFGQDLIAPARPTRVVSGGGVALLAGQPAPASGRPLTPPPRPPRAVPGGGVALLAGHPAPADPNDPTQPQSVYVRDSAAAADQLALAARMERLKEWSKAADIYQEIIDKF